MRQKILELLQTRPFQPFWMELSSGAIHVIRHPDQVMVYQNLLFVGVPRPDVPVAGPDYADVAIISLLHVTKLEMLQQTASSNS